MSLPGTTIGTGTANLDPAPTEPDCPTIDTVTVRIGSTETFPYVVGVYVCTCGATVEQRGTHACDAPDGWVPVEREAEPDYVCPGCIAEHEPALRV